MINKKTILILIVGLVLVSLANANTITTLGIYKQNSCIELKQSCADCSYVNFTRVSYPDGTRAMNNTEATKDGSNYNLEFCNTEQLGTYIVEGIGDVGGTDTVFAYDFEVTLNGKEPAEGILVVVFILIFIGIFFFGLIFFFQALEQAIQLNMDLYDTIKLMGSYFSMWMFYYFSMEYLGNSFINDILEVAVSIGAYTHVFLPLVGFLVSFIMTNLKFKKKARITY
jgi:hypothetical protein